MKKLKKIALSLMSMAFLVTSFIACSNDDSDSLNSEEIHESANTILSSNNAFNEETELFKEMISQALNDKPEDIDIQVINVKESYINDSLRSFLREKYSLVNFEEVKSSYYEVLTPNGLFKINSVALHSGLKKRKEIAHLSKGEGLDLIAEFDLDENTDLLTIDNVTVYSNCYGSYSVACADFNGDGQVSYGECFRACMSYTFDTSETMGMVIAITGAASAVCQACGFVAATLVAIAVVGCAGGCA